MLIYYFVIFLYYFIIFLSGEKDKEKKYKRKFSLGNVNIINFLLFLFFIVKNILIFGIIFLNLVSSFSVVL